MHEFCMVGGYMEEPTSTSVSKWGQALAQKSLGTRSGQYGTKPNPEFAADTDQGKLLGVNF